MGILAQRKAIGELITLGQQYYSEALFRVYLVNTPFLFRAVFSVVAMFLHPVTQAKCITLGSPEQVGAARVPRLSHGNIVYVERMYPPGVSPRTHGGQAAKRMGELDGIGFLQARLEQCCARMPAAASSPMGP